MKLLHPHQVRAAAGVSELDEAAAAAEARGLVQEQPDVLVVPRAFCQEG